jgi:hypothetical protein
MEEQQDKDCYHYTSQIIHMKGYIKQIIWKLLQDKLKSESIMKRLRRSKDKKKSAIKRKLEKDL